MFDKEREAIFDTLAAEWSSLPGPPLAAALELLEGLQLEDKVVLDVGAGTGALVEAGLLQRPRKWVCCDISKAMLAQIEAVWSGDPLVKTLHADAHNLPLEDYTFDAVICNAVLPHLRDRSRALGEFHRVLGANGKLAINHFQGRIRINAIHKSSSYPLLREDILPPAEMVVAELEELGFEILQSVDNEERYLIIARKPE